jgi:hypothetical protein
LSAPTNYFGDHSVQHDDSLSNQRFKRAFEEFSLLPRRR